MSHGNWKEMFKAVENNDAELLQYYIQQGIDINYQHPEYFTSALIESIRRQYNNITRILLQNGASPYESEVYSNKTALQIAEELKNLEAIQLIKQYSKEKEKP